MAKLMTSSKVFTAETIAALNTAANDSAAAIAAACIDGARVGITRDKFLMELRKVSNIPCNTAAASAGLRAAGEEGATLATVANAIKAQYEKDRLSAIARRKAAKKTKGAEEAGAEEAGAEEAGAEEAGADLSGLTLGQLELRRAALKKELAEIEAQIRAMKAAAAAATPAMGDSSVAAS